LQVRKGKNLTGNAKTRKYLALVAASAFLLLALELGFNCLVDPLYFFKGDLIRHRSHPYDDRIATIARYRKNPGQYDCIILGSSRTTFLDPHSIKNHRCANFATVGAGADAVLTYADYIKNVMDIHPGIVIIGVDGFRDDASRAGLPDFVKSKESLPSLFYYYSSLEVFIFSLKHTLFPEDYQIFADRNFRKHQTTALINSNKFAKENKVSIIMGGNNTPGMRFQRDYQSLRNLFPDARLIGFIPPIAPGPIYTAYNRSGLNGFFNTAYAFSSAFDDFYDFSVPSSVSTDLGQTYDGNHYTAETYDIISDVIFKKQPNFGIHVTGLTLPQYEFKYIEKMKQIFGNAFVVK
jgi:hypothetical protein